MFVFTAVSHSIRSRPDLIISCRPAPNASVAGRLPVCSEFIDAIGLLVPQVMAAAPYGLIALLVAMFLANVHPLTGLVVADAAPVLSFGGYRCNCFGFRPCGGWGRRCPLVDNDGQPMLVACVSPLNLGIQNRSLSRWMSRFRHPSLGRCL
jgi:hypothetical protein